jgi:hypothetical protein
MSYARNGKDIQQIQLSTSLTLSFPILSLSQEKEAREELERGKEKR